MPFCPHCNRNTFEIIAVDVAGTKYNCVQCSGCKAPVSFVERARVEESDEAFETRVTEALVLWYQVCKQSILGSFVWSR